MYLPPHFEESRPEALQRLVHDHPLGLLVTQQGGALQADALPFLLDPAQTAGATGVLRGHVARANPLWQVTDGEAAGADADVLVVFQGPRPMSRRTGTRARPSTAASCRPGYMTVQARGRLRAIHDPAWLLALVTRLTERHEAAQPRAWSVIVGIEIVLTSLQGKWKLSQNRPAADRDDVAQGLRRQPGGVAAAVADQIEANGGAAGY